MAGGSGTRLWPASTSSRPKQLLSIPSISSNGGAHSKNVKSSSFFAAALDHALTVTGDSGDNHVIIVAGRKHIDLILGECAKLDPREQKRLILIPEPVSKNTAPAIACALVYLDWISAGSDRNVLILSSDHIIQPLNIFKTDVNAAVAMAQADKLVVFGIPIKKLVPGYGFIKTGEALSIPPDTRQSRRQYEPEVFSVASFREKPDLKEMKNAAAKNFFWNPGIYAFSSKFMLAEFRRRCPDVIDPFDKLLAPYQPSHKMRKGISILEDWAGLDAAYRKTGTISFENAIAEKCRATIMVKAGFSWSNVGSWDEYARLVKKSEAIVFATDKADESCFVDSDIPVALCGVEDLIVVVRSGKDGGPPAILISKKGETQRVREIVEKIKASKRTDLL